MKSVNKGAVIHEPGNSTRNKTGGWRMVRPVVDVKKCIGCGKCWALCPDNAIKMVNKKAVVNYDFCKGCLICLNICPVHAIRSEKEEK
tara:strand:- start:8 stop:271 length:264 start_codon:yes stop_codon:yes gene_type:complete